MGDHSPPPNDLLILLVCGGAVMALIIGTMVWGVLSVY